MPFLPSEGEETKLLINQQMKDVLVFHYLPISWYRYPIPNNIREYWYNERPDILDYMQKAYKDLSINFLPDNITSQPSGLVSQQTNITDYISTEVLSQQNLIQSHDFGNHINFHDFVMSHISSFF